MAVDAGDKFRRAWRLLVWRKQTVDVQHGGDHRTGSPVPFGRRDHVAHPLLDLVRVDPLRSVSAQWASQLNDEARRIAANVAKLPVIKRQVE